MTYLSRRHVLSGLGTAGFAASLGSMSQLGFNRAWAADTSNYKAMVCIFLKGGMDGSDSVLPYDQASYDLLKRARPSLFDAYSAENSTSSRHRSNLLKLNTEQDFGGREFALPRELSGLHSMFEAGDLAVVGNVGPLIEPTTKAGLIQGSAILPPRLFSHNDQQSTWMALEAEGAQLGWGGRFMDHVLNSAPNQNPVFSSITTWDSDVFLSGQNVSPFKVFAKGMPSPDIYHKPWLTGYTSEDDAARDKIRRFLARKDLQSQNILETDLSMSRAKAVENSEVFRAAQSNATALSTSFENDSISDQMKSVAETIKIRQHLNVSRQMFYVNGFGYDTHSNQAGTIGGLHEMLSNGLAAFRQAMIEIGEWDNVIVFTASDFGRTVIDNGNGTDHGWGGHHFVAGGSVAGRQIYGDVPTAEVNSESYTETRGRLIPSISVEQYAATMGSWFGLSAEELQTALPNLKNFDSSNVGFMG